MCQETRAYPMTNSHILLPEFDYVEPHSLDEATALLAEYGDRAQLLAGGSYLLVQMKQELAAPELVVNLSHVPGLRGAGWRDNRLCIGALATIREIHDMAQRFHVARMLDRGEHYTHIQDVTGASATTISRVSKALNYGADGYRAVIDRLGPEEDH